ncbi:hypothetical protein [Halorubrum laminariae]|uniref:Uncharacterized protein n=1 Tax=Halorubrum laminariae TaxID=1433523 RepID=A0ABD6C359_9EURY|nr:hypothetical protein [Halorubrum laminariae]
MDETLHDALDAIAFLLAVIAAAALAVVTLQYGLGGLGVTLLFFVALTIVGSAAGVIPDREGLVSTDDQDDSKAT